jgi:hypothetical protein
LKTIAVGDKRVAFEQVDEQTQHRFEPTELLIFHRGGRSIFGFRILVVHKRVVGIHEQING